MTNKSSISFLHLIGLALNCRQLETVTMKKGKTTFVIHNISWFLYAICFTEIINLKANIDLVSRIKSATVGIGLVEKNGHIPKAVFGSGFFVKPEGYMMTAQHVLDDCIKWYNFLNRNTVKVEFVAFHVWQEGSILNLNVLPFEKVSSPSKTYKQGEYPGPEDPDIGYAIPNERLNVPYLDFKRDGKSDLYSEICICGYPAGGQSLDPEKKFGGIRFNPVVQFGYISGYMATDNSIVPYGIQTDIIGTAGSSGSPIVALESGSVIGFSQQVFTADINFEIPSFKIGDDINIPKLTGLGTVKIGLIYGLTTFQFPDFPDRLKAFVENNVPLMVPFRSSVIRLGELKKTGNRPWLP
jgi:hypothetical protein